MKPRPSCYSGAIPNKVVLLWGEVVNKHVGKGKAFSPLAGMRKKRRTSLLWEASLKLGGSCDICERAVASSPLCSSQRSSLSASHRCIT